MKTDQPKRYDSEYDQLKRNLFIFFRTLGTDTATDWAYQIQKFSRSGIILEKITLVIDNLNTHVGASLYKTFKPQEARRILDKLELHYTPKHQYG